MPNVASRADKENVRREPHGALVRALRPAVGSVVAAIAQA